MALLTFPYATIFDTSGVLAPGALAYFYEAGTSTPLDTYSDADLSTANTNPVVADAAGALGPVYLKPQAYKIVIKDASGSTIKTVDNYSPIATGEQILWAGTVGGTADAVLLTTDPLVQSLRDGTMFWWRAASTNTTSMTINLDGTGVKNFVWPDGTAMAAGDIAADAIVVMAYDATNGVYNCLSMTAPPVYRTGSTFTGDVNMSGAAFNEAEGTAIASASTIDLDAATGNFVHVTGTTSITAVTLADGAERTVVFDGALTLTNGAGLLLPGSANITTAANDVAVFRGEGSSVTRCVIYQRKDGTPLVSAGRLLAIQTFTASGTYTPTAGMAFCIVRAIAPGGSGRAQNTTTRSAGGAGEGCLVKFTSADIGASQTVTINSPGAGVTPTTDGNAGGTVVFGTLITMNGGGGGTSGLGGTGGSGGSISGGTTLAHMNGQPGTGQSASIINDTRGGMAPFGWGVGGEGLSGANGIAGSGYGSGGSGSSTGTSGAGAAGIIVVEEYS